MQRWWLAAVLGMGVLGAAQAQDELEYRDRVQKKKNAVTVVITNETAVGLEIKGRGKEDPKVIPPEDILHITYKVKNLLPAEYRKPFNAEEKALKATKAAERITGLEKAADLYKELDREIKGHPGASRYIQYRLAKVAVLLAQEDPTKTEEAIKALEAYRTANPVGWEITLALKELARLQEESGKIDDARKSYEALVDLPELPREAKQESEILVSKLLLRGKNYTEAEKRLKALNKSLALDDPQRGYVQAYLADSQMGQDNLGQVETQLKDALKGSVDPRLHGVVHNLLGDYYRKKNQPEEAFWHYLRVDALYNDDVEEQAKALYHLRVLFDKVKNDRVRAEECTNRLLDKRYQGTVYQKLVPAKTKSP